MTHLAWLVIATSGVVFGQLQNFGAGTDPDEKKRGEKMLSQTERGVALNEQMVKQQQTAIRISTGAFIVSLVSLLIALVALFHHGVAR